VALDRLASQSLCLALKAGIVKKNTYSTATAVVVSAEVTMGATAVLEKHAWTDGDE